MVLDSAFSNLFDLMLELADVYKIRVPKFTVCVSLHDYRDTNATTRMPNERCMPPQIYAVYVILHKHSMTGFTWLMEFCNYIIP